MNFMLSAWRPIFAEVSFTKETVDQPGVVLDAYHLPGAYNFKVALRFFGKFLYPKVRLKLSSFKILTTSPPVMALLHCYTV